MGILHYTLVLILIISISSINCSPPTLDITFTPTTINKDTLKTGHNGIPWGDTYNISITLHASEPMVLNVSVQCVHEDVCTIDDHSLEYLNFTHAHELTITKTLTINALFIGRSPVIVRAQQLHSNTNVTINPHPDFEVVVLRSASSEMFNTIFTALMIVFVTVNTFMMGTQLHWHVIVENVKKPIGSIIGLGCQYLFMPVLAYICARVFLEGYPNLQFGLFVYGCSPGGGQSNFWTLLLDGNLDLSVTMTFFSSVAALFMLPAWLYTVGRSFYSGSHLPPLPFENIAISLGALLVPTGLGMLLAHYKPHWVPKFTRIIKYFTVIVLIIVIAFSSYANWYIYLLIRWYTLVPGLLIPTFGYALSYLTSWLLRQRHRECRTISIETGIQNAALAILICQLSLGSPDSEITLVMPVCCLMFTGLPLWIWLAIRTIRKRKFGYIDPDVQADEEEMARRKKLATLDTPPIVCGKDEKIVAAIVKSCDKSRESVC